MISLVDVILKYAKNQDEAWREIEEGEIRSCVISPNIHSS